MNECSILWCGKYHQNWENELHCHNYFQMVGILSGSGTVYVDDQPYEIEKEQVFLLCPQQLHAIHCGEKNAAPLKMLDVKFTVADPALFECCFSKRMRKVFRENEKSMLQNCTKKAKRKGRLQRVKKPM